jgi:signal transduction histidine kinase/DNA-binding NarL/FixJ family response regulator
MTKDQILVIDADPVSRQALSELLTQWGYPRVTAADAAQGLPLFEKTRPAVVVINVTAGDGMVVVSDLRALMPDVVIIAAAAADRLVQAMEHLKHTAEDFLPLPVVPVAFEIALTRASRTVFLQREIKNTCSQNRIAQTCANVSREVENERFLAVRQIVEKMSAFIAQVATGVQGGVKYFNELPYFVSVHAPDCRVLAANPTYMKYLGKRLYRSSWGIYAGKRATREGCPVGRTVRSGDVLTTRALVRYSSGAKVPVLVHTAPIYDNEGEVALVLEIFAGTQEIDQLAQSIRTTQQRYELLFDAIPSWVAVLDRRLNLTALNQKFKQAFGDQRGCKFFDLFRPATFPAHRDPISLTWRDGLAHHGEMVLTGPDHRQYTLLAHTAPIVTSMRKMIQVLVIFTDITELRHMKDHLASMGLMFSTVCHDIKGCLTGLDAGLYLIDKGFYRDKPGRIEEGLEVTRMMVARIQKLVLDVLYSTKERALELEVIDALKFAGDVTASMENRIRGADIRFNCDFSLCAGELEIDCGLLRSALINILENAMDACLEDDRNIAHAIDFIVQSRQSEVVIEIRDNGMGMTADQTQHLFDIFYSSKGSKGTGLGLYITHKVIQKHGGTIEVDSIHGRGTSLRVHIPRQAAMI